MKVDKTWSVKLKEKEAQGLRKILGNVSGRDYKNFKIEPEEQESLVNLYDELPYEHDNDN